ncbi:MAG: FHA domain-containing protein [Solirubrobacteraceae bacterium]
MSRPGIELEIVSGQEPRSVRLDADRTTIGKASDNDVALSDDPAVSRLHAAVERFAAGWVVTDLGSSNGTWLNGDRVTHPRRIRDGDEIRVGQTRLIVRAASATPETATLTESEPPELTRRERDVLVSLCRPLLARDLFAEPASTRVIAEELVVTLPAVKQHLANLYVKFAIAADESSKRVRLANEALRRGAVSLADLRSYDS